MSAPSSFRIPAEEVSAWVSRMAAWRGQKGVEGVLREMEDVARKVGSDGHVVVTRHQLFSWAEALVGVASKLPLSGADTARGLADELRAYLTGRPAAPPAPAAPAVAPPAPAAASATGLSWDPPAAPSPAATAPAPVTYVRSTAASGGEARLVADRDLASAVQEMIRGARQEILVVSPWRGGLDSLLPDLLALPAQVPVRILTRRPEPDDPVYHRALADLARRKADLAASPFLHTRMIVVDGQRLLLGAASLPGATTTASREVALITSDPKAVEDARALFAAWQRQLRGGV